MAQIENEYYGNDWKYLGWIAQLVENYSMFFYLPWFFSSSFLTMFSHLIYSTSYFSLVSYFSFSCFVSSLDNVPRPICEWND